MRTVVLLFFMGLCGPLLALATAPVRADTDVLLVVFTPGRDVARLVEAAGGRLVGPEIAPFGALASGGAADFATTLRDAGVWVFDGAALAAICGVDS